jgi:hypothetical protein
MGSIKLAGQTIDIVEVSVGFVAIFLFKFIRTETVPNDAWFSTVPGP